MFHRQLINEGHMDGPVNMIYEYDCSLGHSRLEHIAQDVRLETNRHGALRTVVPRGFFVERFFVQFEVFFETV